MFSLSDSLPFPHEVIYHLRISRPYLYTLLYNILLPLYSLHSPEGRKIIIKVIVHLLSNDRKNQEGIQQAKRKLLQIVAEHLLDLRPR